MSFSGSIQTSSSGVAPVFQPTAEPGPVLARWAGEVARLAGQDPAEAARALRGSLADPLGNSVADSQRAGAVLERLGDAMLGRLAGSADGRDLLALLDRPLPGAAGPDGFHRIREALREVVLAGESSGRLPAGGTLADRVGLAGVRAPETTGRAASDPSVRGAFEKEFAAKARDPEGYDRFMRQVFGDGIDAAQAERFRQQALAGDFSFLPPVRLVDSATLGGAHGAYDADAGVVFISRELAASDPATAAQTFVEEAGHHLDARLNTVDSRGDEGELFRRLLSGEQLSEAQIGDIRAEVDSGTITVDGKEVAVEFWNPFKAIADGAKAVGGAIADGAKAVGGAVAEGARWVGGAIGDGAKAVGVAVGHVAGGVWEGVKDVGAGIGGFFANAGQGLYQAAVGFATNLADGNVGEAFQSIVRGVDRLLFQSTARLAGGLLDGFKSAADGITDALGPVGKPLRWVTDRLADIGHTALDTGFGIVRDVVRLGPELITGFISDVERSVKLAADGRWGEAAGQFGMAFVNLPTRVVGTAADVLLRGVQGVASAGQTAVGAEPPARGLNQQERDYLRQIYGDSIDYDAIRVKQGGPLNNVMAPHTVGNTVYMPEEFNLSGGGKGQNFNADGTLTPQGLDTLGHEVGHVWQNQNGGGDYIHKALGSNAIAGVTSGDRDNAYNWRQGLSEGETFESMNDEQRAKAMEDIGAALGSDRQITTADSIDGTALTPAEVAFLNDVWQKVRRGEGAG